MEGSDKNLYMRNPNATVVGNRSGAILISPAGEAFHFRSDTEIAFNLIALLREPKSMKEIEQELPAPDARLDKIIAGFVKQKILLCDTREKLLASLPRRPQASTQLCSKLVVGISGTVQAARIIPLLLTLQGIVAKEIHVVLTDSAEKFIKPESLAYYGFRVWRDTFETQGEINVPHIHLAATADMVLIVPASAHTIHRLATGECSDLLSLIVAATKAPVVVAPTMNAAMLQFGPISNNIGLLRSFGIYVFEPGVGYEVSQGDDEDFKFCGIGLTETNLVRTLDAIFIAHRELTSRKPQPTSD